MTTHWTGWPPAFEEVSKVFLMGVFFLNPVLFRICFHVAHKVVNKQDTNSTLCSAILPWCSSTSYTEELFCRNNSRYQSHLSHKRSTLWNQKPGKLLQQAAFVKLHLNLLSFHDWLFSTVNATPQFTSLSDRAVTFHSNDEHPFERQWPIQI